MAEFYNKELIKIHMDKPETKEYKEFLKNASWDQINQYLNNKRKERIAWCNKELQYQEFVHKALLWEIEN